MKEVEGLAHLHLETARLQLGLKPPGAERALVVERVRACLLYTSPSPRDS